MLLIYLQKNIVKESSNQKKVKEVLKEKKLIQIISKKSYVFDQLSLAPIIWMTFEDISVPVFKLSLIDLLLINP